MALPRLSDYSHLSYLPSSQVPSCRWKPPPIRVSCPAFLYIPAPVLALVNIRMYLSASIRFSQIIIFSGSPSLSILFFNPAHKGLMIFFNALTPTAVAIISAAAITLATALISNPSTAHTFFYCFFILLVVGYNPDGITLITI